MTPSRLFICIVLLGSASIADAGVYIERVTRNAAGQERDPQKMFVQNGKARIETSRGASTVLIFRDDAINVLDLKNSTYQRVDKSTFDQTARMLEEMMAKVPPEQRAMVEQMIKQRRPSSGSTSKAPVYAAKPTGESATIEGHACKLWQVTRDGVLAEQLCVVPSGSLPGADEVASLGKKMATLFESFSESMSSMLGNGIQIASAALGQIDGYPIMMRAYRDGQLSSDQQIVKVWKQMPIDAAQFEIPAGYQKQEMPKLRSN